MNRLLAGFGCGLLLGLVAASCRPTQPPAPSASQCSEVSCKPPPCCGQTCTPDGGGCCVGTVCSDSGKCVPTVCAGCGPAGCTYDPATCEGSCTKPACCLAECTGPADCCPGTECALASSGVKKCFPTGCDTCTGLRTYCKTNGGTCSITCEPPPTCGQACTTDPQCGTGAVCHGFVDAGTLCVPQAFDLACAACAQGCTFDVAACDVRCVGADAGVDGGAGAGDDAGLPDAGACLACCTPCVPDSDAGPACCPGSACLSEDGGPFHCLPTACATCPAGCDYVCPGTK